MANTKVIEMEVWSTLLQDIQNGQLKDENIQEIKRNIKEEKSPGFMEDDQCVYHDLKATYWLYGIKRDIVEYVALCDTCQRVKVEHQRYAALASTRVQVGRYCIRFHRGFV
jgi:hypothetical protein